MLAFVADPDAPDAPAAALTWLCGRSLVSVEDGSPDDGDRVTQLTDAGLVTNAAQATAGDRPVWRPAIFPGRGAIEVSAARHLRAAVSGPIGAVVVLVAPGSGSRGLVARDTSATTDKPAFVLTVTEDFG